MGNWKGYGRVYHRNIGKVTKFELFRIIIFRSYCHFSVGGAENAPPPPVVGLKRTALCNKIILYYLPLDINIVLAEGKYRVIFGGGSKCL